MNIWKRIPRKWSRTIINIVTVGVIPLLAVLFASSLVIAACIDNPTDATPLNGGTYNGGQMFSIDVNLGDTLKVKVPTDGDDIYMILYGPMSEDSVCEIRRGSNIEGPGTKTLEYTFTWGDVWYLKVYGYGTVNEYQLEVTWSHPEEEEPQKIEPKIELTNPVGISPKVFTKGWVFGAKCTYIENGTTIDISDQVTWSGSGTFSPIRGSRSYPTFTSEGANKIILTVELKGESYQQEFSVETVSPLNYARLGDLAKCPADAHGCPACAHPTTGPIITGSPNVSINGLPAARVGDAGVHATCCNGNMYSVNSGDNSILIDGFPAAKKGDQTKHCGGVGRIISGSSGADASLSATLENQFDKLHACKIKPAANAKSVTGGSISGQVTDSHDIGIKGIGVTAFSSVDTGIWGSLTDNNGHYKIEGLPDGNLYIYFWGGNWAYNDGYLSEWYQDKSNMAASDTITVSDGSEITAIDAILSEGGSISGTVTDTHGTGVYKATLKAVDELGEIIFSYTDEKGDYRFAGLAGHNYQLLCNARSLGYLDQWYDGQSSPNSSTIIAVTTTSSVSGIDFSLASGGGISGTVRNNVGKGIEDISITIFGNATGITGMGVTDVNGEYEIKGLPDDGYRIRFQGENKGYRNQWYNDQANWDTAAMVPLVNEKQLTGIDTALTLVGDGDSPTADNDSSSGGGCIISILSPYLDYLK